MIVVFQHYPIEVPARLGDALRDHGHKLHTIELYEGDQVPVDLDNVDGIVSMGGPMNVDEVDQYDWIEKEMAFIRMAHEAGKPIVGICLGAQLIAAALDGEVGHMPQPEVGWETVTLGFPGTTDPVMAGIPWKTQQFHFHGCEVTQPPPGALVLSSSEKTKVQAFCINQTTYGFQYHFEWDRQMLIEVLDDAEDVEYMQKHGIDPQAIKDQLNEYYELYRHLGDRVCKRLTDLVFPLDHRLDHKSGTLTSFDPAIS